MPYQVLPETSEEQQSEQDCKRWDGRRSIATSGDNRVDHRRFAQRTEDSWNTISFNERHNEYFNYGFRDQDEKTA
jgi:hypothetical protein